MTVDESSWGLRSAYLHLFSLLRREKERERGREGKDRNGREGGWEIERKREMGGSGRSKYKSRHVSMALFFTTNECFGVQIVFCS